MEKVRISHNSEDVNEPLISLVLSVYNTEAYLVQCLESVLAQSYTHWELLIGDDGSTDGSSKICDDYAARDARIVVWHKLNTGKSDTCNALIKRARGEYIAFLDSDDWMDRQLLSTLLTAIKDTGAECSACGWYMDYVTKGIPFIVSEIQQLKSRAEAITLFYDRKLYSTFWGKLFHRSLLKEPIPQKVRLEDHAVLYKWISHAEKMVFCPEILYHYRQRRSSIMNSGMEATEIIPILEESYRYIAQYNLLSEEENKRIVVTQLIREAKYAARHFDSGSVGTLNHIRTFLTSIQPVSEKIVDRKTYHRMQLLLQMPRYFLLSQRLCSLFVRGHHQPRYELYL